MRLRRSSKLMHYDPITLVIAPTVATGSASGTLYLDDEYSLAHETHGQFVHRQFQFADNKLQCRAAPVPSVEVVSGPAAASIAVQQTNKQQKAYQPPNTVERIEIAGQSRAAKRVILSIPGQSTVELVSFYDPTRKVITIKKPDVKVADDWSITLEF